MAKSAIAWQPMLAASPAELAMPAVIVRTGGDMNIHAIIDHALINLAVLITGKRKFFRNNIESMPFPRLLQEIRLQMPSISGTGVYEFTADTPVGRLDPALHMVQWRGPDYPLFIYHHGNNETPFAYGRYSKNTFKSIVREKQELFPLNLMVLRAPFHQSLSLYMDKVGELTNFMAMLAVSAKVVEAVTGWYRQLAAPAPGRTVAVGGISLGGFVTNLHRTYYNSADRYLPIMAGAALDAVFAESIYRKLTGALALANPDALRQALNFEADFGRISTQNLFPLLARYDQIVEYPRQQQCYTGYPVTVLEKGHSTAALDAQALRDYLLAHLLPLCNKEPVDSPARVPAGT
jgi:hypothetical protein